MKGCVPRTLPRTACITGLQKPSDVLGNHISVRGTQGGAGLRFYVDLTPGLGGVMDTHTVAGGEGCDSSQCVCL